MLEFIVLGQIPGTQIIITFHWVVIMALVLLCVSLIKSANKRQQGLNSDQNIEEITL